jgi:hypothetical protein
MLAIEKTAMEVVDALLSKEQIPLKNLRRLSLRWEPIDGDYFPVLYCEFYKIVTSVDLYLNSKEETGKET